MSIYNQSLKLIRIASYQLIKVHSSFYELAKCPDEILISYLCMHPEATSGDATARGLDNRGYCLVCLTAVPTPIGFLCHYERGMAAPSGFICYYLFSSGY